MFANIKNKKQYNKITRLLLMVVLMFSAMFVCSENAKAVGNHSMHQSVGSSSSSGNSYGGSSYRGSSYGGSSSSGGTIDLIELWDESPLLCIFIVVLVIGVSQLRRGLEEEYREERYQRSYQEPNEYLRVDKMKNKAILEDIQNRDPNFSEEQFISKTQNIFIVLQEAWVNNNWKVARMYETDELFNVHRRQLESIVNRNRTNYVENITFVNTDIVEYDQDENNDIVKVLFEVRLIDYTVDNETGNVVFGDRRKILHLKYLYTFIRSKGVITEGGSSINTTNCPSCGAPVNVNASGMCEYCGTAVVNGTYDWVVSNVESKPNYRIV